jgi:hypothetical protein
MWSQGRAPPEAAIPQEPPSVSAPPPTAGAPARVAPKPSLNLLDFDDTAAMSAPPLAEPEPTGARHCGAYAMDRFSFQSS